MKIAHDQVEQRRNKNDEDDEARGKMCEGRRMAGMRERQDLLGRLLKSSWLARISNNGRKLRPGHMWDHQFSCRAEKDT